MTAVGFTAIDWGTTNRRLFRFAPTGEVVERRVDDRGVASWSPGDLDREIAALAARYDKGPLILAGMIGSNRGWREVPYLGCPLGLRSLADGVFWGEPGRIAIVPGAASIAGDRADVMRGEEVQLLGAAAARLVPPDALLCLPGTHAKWATLVGGELAAFRTTMTGELFALLRDRSLLSEMLVGEVADGPAFRDGARRALTGGALSADLFGARARVLLGLLPRQSAAAYVSGLLIGEDVRIGLDGRVGGPVALIGGPALTDLYAAALDEVGCSSRRIDGEEAFIAGARALKELLP